MSEELLTGESTEPAEAQTETTTESVTTEAEQQGEQATTELDGAPESYEDFAVPDGKQFDPEVISAYKEVAKELNLSQDKAQQFLDKMAPVIDARNQQRVEALKESWSEASKADKQFGGDNLDANLATAKKALDSFGTPELKSMLQETGLGNHPEVIRLLYQAGKAMSDDKIVTGKASPQDTRSLADRLYS